MGICSPRGKAGEAAAQAEGYRSRAAFKLKELDERFRLIPKQGRVVDLVRYADFQYPSPASCDVLHAKAPARISFAGGGTDVTEYFEDHMGIVLSATINRYCYGTIVRRIDSKIRLFSEDFEDSVAVDSLEEMVYDGKLDLIKAAIKVMNPEFGFDLYTRSDLRPGSGLGGSAAIASVVIGLLNS